MSQVYYADATPHISRHDYPILWDKLNNYTDAVFLRTEERLNDVLSQFFFRINKDSGRTHTIADVGQEMPTVPISEDGQENLIYAHPPAGFKTTYTLYPRRLGVRVEENAVKEDGEDKIMQMVQGLMPAIFWTISYSRADVFNSYGFSGTSGADALSMINDSHPNEEYGTGTWDNYVSGTLTGDNLQAGILLAQLMTGPRGRPLMKYPRWALANPTQERKLLELIRSPQRAEDAFNAVTVKIDKMEVITSPLITSTTNVYLISEEEGWQKGLHEVFLIQPKVIDNSPTDGTIIFDKQVKAHYAMGYYSCRHIVGISGS